MLIELVPVPSTFDYAEGATFLAAHGTAYHALIDRGQIRPGEVLLVHGAGGGVGLAAVEIGKLLGATVIAAASSEEKLAIARERGADHLVLYAREPFRDAVKRLTDGRGADGTLDAVGMEAHGSPVAQTVIKGVGLIPDAVAKPMMKTMGIDRLAALRDVVELHLLAVLGSQLTGQAPGDADVTEVIHDRAENVPTRPDRQSMLLEPLTATTPLKMPRRIHEPIRREEPRG